VRSNDRILVDGGLTNPVPASVVRVMGADIVVAVDLNHGIIAGKNLKPLLSPPGAGEAIPSMFPRRLDSYRQSMRELKAKLLALEAPGAAQFSRWVSAEPLPSIFEVLLASINIMETRITASRLSLDRPDVIIQPPLGHIRFLEFGRAEEIITIGYEHARRQLASLSTDWIQKSNLSPR
jgi:NTE family protein